MIDDTYIIAFWAVLAILCFLFVVTILKPKEVYNDREVPCEGCKILKKMYEEQWKTLETSMTFKTTVTE